MKLLVVGGTSFVGRAIAWSAWHHGHQVTVFNRGVTPSDLPESVEHLVGDRQGDLSALDGRDFDATVDATAYRPSDVDRLADVLSSHAGHYLQISSVSAYEEPSEPGATEATATLWPEGGVDTAGPITESSYGPLKAASERAGRRRFGDGSTMVRPTYVIGSHDVTLRFPYWVERARRGGEIAVPGPREAPLQYVDARDLANFVVRLAEDHVPGVVHVVGPSWGARFVDVIAEVGDHAGPEGTTVREVSAEAVRAAGLEGKFPLWGGHATQNISRLDNALALSLGLNLRPLEDSVDDVLEWWGERPWPTSWLRADEESALLGR
jgi:2'-hydroxyisoflavone reductase